VNGLFLSIDRAVNKKRAYQNRTCTCLREEKQAEGNVDDDDVQKEEKEEIVN